MKASFQQQQRHGRFCLTPPLAGPRSTGSLKKSREIISQAVRVSDLDRAMRKFLASMVVAGAAFSSSAWAFKAGDALTPDALGKSEVIQGEAPKAWEPGKVYVMECWATWCGPCVAAIPHVDALYDKYKDKGLRVIGMNVMENEKEKVAEFVKKKGDGMSYPVLFTGPKDSAFDKEWMTPGGVDGIPYAFVVKDGKFLFGTHPSKLDGELIEKLLEGGAKQEEAIKSLSKSDETDEAVNTLIGEFLEAMEAKDVPVMEKKLAEIEKLDAKSSDLPELRSTLQITKKDWAAFEKLLPSLEADQTATVRAAIGLDEQTDVPETTRKAMLATLTKQKFEDDDSFVFLVISRYQWLTGDKDGAKANAQKAAKSPGDYPAKIFNDYAASVEAGKPQSIKEVFEAYQQEMQGVGE